LDVYPKTLSEFNEKTETGGLISLLAIALIGLLLCTQLSAYCTVRTRDHLSVDVERERLIRINLNITFPAIPCAGIGLVTMDVAGEQQIDVVQNLGKTRLFLNGSRLD
ncbi:endoplasmic reticulum-golgi intermediate compartment-domain-containing protein, partial [Pavlovales sp. CCMP2436]